MQQTKLKIGNMPSGGHNVKSKEQHKKDGTFKPSRHDGRLQEATTPVKSVPNTPEHFDKRHRDMWQSACKQAISLGTLTDADVYLMEVFVETWFLWKDAMKDVKKTGYTIVAESPTGTKTMVNPAVAIMSDSGKVISALTDKFGFNARARMGIKVNTGETAKKKSILDLMKGGTFAKATKTG